MSKPSDADILAAVNQLQIDRGRHILDRAERQAATRERRDTIAAYVFIALLAVEVPFLLWLGS